MIFLGGGLPLADYFPWDTVNVDSPKPPFTKGIGAALEHGDEQNVMNFTLAKSPATAGKGDVPLARSLQYGFSQGQPELLHFLREHTKIIHQMQYSDWDVVATTGNTNSWESTLRVFCNRGDVILAEAHSFSSSLASAEAQGVTCFPVPLDDHGIIPEKLDDILNNWTEGAPKPKLLYTIPTGQNPTGSSLSDSRKEKIYKIAQKHDFLIIEDEPYYFLQMDKYVRDYKIRESVQDANQKHTHEQFLKSLAKTFLSCDTDGRVIRMDSFSKVLAPGVRIGWITGSAKLLSAYVSLHEMTIQAPAGFAQSIVAGTLNRWGQDGYLDWLIKLRHEYSAKRDCAIDALYEYIPQTNAFTISPPVAGMFFIVTIDASTHPEFATKYGSDPHQVELALYQRNIDNGVLLVPGYWFETKGDTTPPQPSNSKGTSNPNLIFFRGTYAAVAPEKLTEGLKRVGDALYEEFGIKR